MKVVVIDANWSCSDCGRWIKPSTLGRLGPTIYGLCERDGVTVPTPRPHRVRIEEDAA